MLYQSGRSFERMGSAIEKTSGGLFEEQTTLERHYLLLCPFIAVCLYLVIKMKGALHTSAHPELGLLLFMLPSAW